MQCEIVKSVSMILSLEEAKWLHSLFQNPLRGETPQEEDSIEKNFRYNIWQPLDEILH